MKSTDTNLLYEMVPESISIKQPIMSPAIHSYGNLETEIWIQVVSFS